jgi:hypothetical protein
MTHIIKTMHDGISMNIIVYRWLIQIYRSDSCLAGLGGYSDSGFAWQYYLKPEHQFQATKIFWSTLRLSSHPGLTLFAVICIRELAPYQRLTAPLTKGGSAIQTSVSWVMTPFKPQ